MKFFLFILLTYTVTFGSSQDQYTLTPVSEGKQRFTNSITIVEDDNARAFLNFDEQAGDYFEFFVVVENKCDSAVMFDPLEVYTESYKDENDLSEKPEVISSADPDEQLKYIDNDIVKLKKQNNLNEGMSCLFAGFTVAAGVASGQSADENIAQTGSILDDIVADEDEFEYNKYNLEQEKQFWQTEVLRSSLIRPGNKTAGYFFVPISSDARWVQVVVPLGEKEYVFNYRQNKISLK
jgi:hypothetical protein